MKRVIGIVLLTLAGCATAPDLAGECLRYGFKEGTSEQLQCMQTLQQAHAAQQERQRQKLQAFFYSLQSAGTAGAQTPAPTHTRTQTLCSRIGNTINCTSY